jgi:hypothetical protein
MENKKLDPFQPVHNLNPYKHVQGTHQIERFFRVAASLDVDKADIKRYYDFVDQKVEDLLLISQATASANGRDIVQPWDLPITKGLQESIHAFEELDVDIGLERIAEETAPRPPLDRPLSVETEARLPLIVGGMSLALARTFKITAPELKNPATEHWEHAFEIFDQLL